LVGCKLIGPVIFRRGGGRGAGETCDFTEKIADSLTFDDALAEALLFLSELGMSRVLRPEQKEAISSLVHGSDL